MAQRVLQLTCVIPAGTAIASPAVFPLQFPAADVERIDVRIPPGPSGLVGFSINHGGGNFIPEGSGNWIIGDDDRFQWPLDGAPNNGNWQIVAYNTDIISHTIYVSFNVNDLVVVSMPSYGSAIGL